MKTNPNFFSKLSKASFILALAFTTLVTVSCQNAAHQTFSYKTNFIKQMVYKISNEFYTRTGVLSACDQNNANLAAPVLVNYTISVKHSSVASKVNENELADFLTRAAQLNAPVAETASEVAEDNTLDFLTQAAQMNAPVADMEAEQDNTLDFLTQAAQFNAPVAQDNNSCDDTLDLLINAAQFNAPVASDEISQDNNLLEFLTQAAHMNDRVAE